MDDIRYAGGEPRYHDHKISVFKEAHPIVQKKRIHGDEKRLASKEETKKLLAPGSIREARYTTWLANLVMVTKSNDKWKMCLNYTNLHRNIKEVQQLMGSLIALSRFVPQLAERTKPMVQLLLKVYKFSWDEKCEKIFQQLKNFLSSPAVIQKPRPDQPIVVYLVVFEKVVSAALVQEVENEGRPIYFVSRTLHAAKTRYQMIEKVTLVLVLMMASRMRPYFQNHSITVRTDYLIFKILSKSDLAR